MGSVYEKARQEMGKHMTEKKNFFSMEHATVVDTGLQNQIVQQFISECDCDVFCIKTDLVTLKKDHSFREVVLGVKGLLTDGRAVMPHGDMEVIVHGRYKNTPALILISNSDRHEANDEVLTLTITAFADAKESDNLKTDIDRLYTKEKLAKVKWWFDGRHGGETKDIFLPVPKTKLLPEFYPTIGDPHAFMKDFLNSDAGVLLMAGAPGTGKTTLLRHMIIEHKLAAHIIYDEKIMEKDSVFQSFLFDSDGDIMVIEDADTILTARDRGDGNKMMSRFLSVSDGLIKLPNKKLVFTTNVDDFNRVDDALLRPGRCYGIVETRALSLHEAQKAATAAGLPVPIQNKTYTLGELFNPQQGASPQQKAGFGVKH